MLTVVSQLSTIKQQNESLPQYFDTEVIKTLNMSRYKKKTPPLVLD